MARTVDQLLDASAALVPVPYRTEARTLLAGAAGALSLVEAFGESAQALTVPSGASGIWLRAIADGMGIAYGPTDTDDSIRAKIKTHPLRGTPDAIRAGINAILTAAESIVGCTIIEGHRSRLYCVDETDTTSYTTDCYCDEDNWIGDVRWVLILCPDGLDTATEDALALAADWLRVCGVETWVQFADGYVPVIAPLEPWPA